MSIAIDQVLLKRAGFQEMLAWYTHLSPRERSAFWACYGGWALDAMDIQLYTFLIPTLSTLWTMSRRDAGIIGGSALMTSAVGGWLTGVLADRHGRVRMLQISILWYSVFTAASGLTNSFTELLVVRSLQGFGFGGEWTAGAVLIGEIVRADYRGKAVGSVQSGWATGWAIAALLSTFSLAYLPDQWGWRVPFFFGAAPALMLVFVRRQLTEPDIFLDSSNSRSPATFLGDTRRIFSPALLRTTVLCSLLSTGALGGYYALMTWLPTYLRSERGLTIFSSGLYLGVVIAGAFAGYIVSAYLVDLIGRRRNFLFFAIGCLTIVASYTQLAVDDELMLILGFPLGFFSTGVFSGMGPFMTELFPTSVRASGQGFAYNCGRAIGAFFPALVGFLSASITLGHAVGVFAGSAYGLLVLAAYCLPETKGKELDETERPYGGLENPRRRPT
jgi:MFS family permease